MAIILGVALIWVAMEKCNYVICNQGATGSNPVAGTIHTSADEPLVPQVRFWEIGGRGRVDKSERPVAPSCRHSVTSTVKGTALS